MKKFILICLALHMLCFCSSCRSVKTDVDNTDETTATTSSTETEQATNPLKFEDVYIYTPQKESENGIYTSFILSTPDKDITFSANQAEYTDSRVFVEDITGDGYPDVAAVFVYATGTGIHNEEIHIFDGCTLKEYPVENMLGNLSSYLYMEADNNKYSIKTSSHTYHIDKSLLETEPENLFDNISIDSINEYTVSNGTVHYTAKCQCGMGEFCGTLDAVLKFSDNGFIYDSAEYIAETSDSE